MSRVESAGAYNAMRDKHAKIRLVPCPRCDAPVAGHCRTPKGNITFPHQQRRTAAANAGVYVP